MTMTMMMRKRREYEAFRCDWSIFSRIHGSFEDTSEFNLLIP
jgi:hypothetical protein